MSAKNSSKINFNSNKIESKSNKNKDQSGGQSTTHTISHNNMRKSYLSGENNGKKPS